MTKQNAFTMITIFSAGIAIGHYLTKSFDASVLDKSDYSHLSDSDLKASNRKIYSHAQNQITQSDRISMVQSSAVSSSIEKTKVSDSPNSIVPKRFVDESVLQNTIHERFPIVNPTLSAHSDGSSDLNEKNGQGTIYQHFNPDAILTRETWYKADGEDIYRSYYNSGQLKTVSWNQSNGTLTNLTYMESGLLEGRSDRFADGIVLSTSYNDLGQPSSVWRTDSTGKSVRVN